MLQKVFNLNKFQISAVVRRIQVQYSPQRRNYCKITRPCWSCNATPNSKNEIFCSKCSKIQNVPENDFFGLFGMQKEHNIDVNDLTKKFRDFQSKIHPDKFSGKSREEQTLSSEWSSLINKAYKTLQSPLERGEYLLRLSGIKLPDENTISDPEFLAEMMEKNEEVEEARSKQELLKILDNLREELVKLSDDFSSLYNQQPGSVDEAKALLIKIKYLTSIEKSIKEKLLKFV